MSESHRTAPDYSGPSTFSHAQVSEAARLLVQSSWAKTADRAARTAKAREASQARFLKLVDPDGVMDPADRERLAAEARHEFYVEAGRKSGQARRAKAVAA